jgi:hypothetical protein
VNKLAIGWLCLVVSIPAFAVGDGQAIYAGGTISGINQGAIMRIDSASQTALKLDYQAASILIPYAAIDSFEFSDEVKRHLGVLPAIAIGLVKQRQRRHFFRISYHDERNLAQVAIFEVSKHAPRVLQAVLQSRVKQSCRPSVRCIANGTAAPIPDLKLAPSNSRLGAYQN